MRTGNGPLGGERCGLTRFDGLSVKAGQAHAAVCPRIAHMR
jgi:hypothetical protein